MLRRPRSGRLEAHGRPPSFETLASLALRMRAERGRRGARSLRPAVRRLEDRRPARDLGLHEGGEYLRRALILAGHRAAELGEPLLHLGVVQRLVERAGKLVDDLLRRTLGREDAGPDAHLVV